MIISAAVYYFGFILALTVAALGLYFGFRLIKLI